MQTWGSEVLHRLLNFIMADMRKEQMMHKSNRVVSKIHPLLGIETSFVESLNSLATKAL